MSPSDAEKQLQSWLKLGASPILRQWKLQISIEDVLRMQSADPAKLVKRNPVFLTVAERALGQGTSLLEPVVVYRALRVEQLRHERLSLESDVELQAGLLAQHLGKAEFVILAVCSIGAGVEKLAKEQFMQDPVYSLALEGYGSAAVETLATEFCAWVDHHAARSGMATSIPLSPGMVGWTVDEGQKQIFKALDAASIGVQLTDASLMLPIKTISLVLGVGAEVKAEGSTCDYCSMRERCHYRDHYLNVETI
ncbi:MAG: hypothetical protein E4G99_08800 [Anaerolineales bacterium]|nr:MAG: hypothetical protein E4G99_08800 [Anaerolineales bacterium]